MMDKVNGFIPLAKQIQNHWLWTDKPFARGQAWIDLLIMANFDSGEIMSKGILVKVERGQVFRTIKFLSERWGWNQKKTRSFLKTLENEKMVSTEGLANGTRITIENYTKWNDAGQTEVTTEGTSRGHVGVTLGSQKKKNNKNNKKDIKEKEILKEKETRYGEFENVALTDDEYTKLVERFPMDYQERIENLSLYLKKTGKRYKSHYATILSWARNDGNASVKKKGRLDWIDDINFGGMGAAR